MTTAYPEYAAPSFELDTIVDYLIKPFSFDRFLKGVNKVKERLNKEDVVSNNDSDNYRDETIFLNVNKTMHKIIISDILYVESNRNYITVVTKNQKLTYIESLKNWTAKLPKDQFIQVHKSFVINSKFVDKLSGNEVYVNANKIPIGRNYKHELLKLLKIA